MIVGKGTYKIPMKTLVFGGTPTQGHIELYDFSMGTGTSKEPDSL